MSIASRITEMEQHIGNAYDKIEDLGIDLTDVDKNINNISSMLEEVWNEYPKVTATDVEEASLNGTKKGRMEIDLKANTEQATTILPDEYQQVEYIESSGTQFINTNYYAKSTTKYAIDFQATSNLSTGIYLFGSRISSTSENISLSLGFNYFVGRGNNFISAGKPDYSRHLIEVNPDSVFLDGTNMSSVQTVLLGTATYPLYLMCMNQGGDLSRTFYGKVFNCKIYDNNILVRNFIPCYRKSDNEIGFYDIVNDEFYTNDGTGTFLKGSDVSVPNPDFPQPIYNVTGNANVKIQNKNLLNSLTETQGYPSNTASAPSTTRLFTENTYVLGIATNNYYAPSSVSIDKHNEDEWEFKTIYSGYGISFPINFARNGSYRLSYEKKGNVNSALLKYDKTGNFIEGVFNNVFETDKNFNYLLVFYTTTTNETVGFSKVQIEQGSTATSYIPHQEQNLPFSLKSKNLFNKDGEVVNTFINDSGQETTSGNRKFIKQILTNIASSYTISFRVRRLGSVVRFAFFNGDTFISRIVLPGVGSSTLNVPQGCTKIDLRTDSDYLGYGFEALQIEEGTTATSYEPYYDIRAMQGTTLEDDGIHQKRKQYAITGNETWELFSNTCVRIRKNDIKGVPDTTTLGDIKCNYLIADTQANIQTGVVDYGIGVRTEGNNGIVIRNKDYTTLEQYTNWFKQLYNNNKALIIEYELAEEETIPYNATQQAQYNAIKQARSYDDQTNISSTSDELGFKMDVEILSNGVSSSNTRTLALGSLNKGSLNNIKEVDTEDTEVAQDAEDETSVESEE